jgi:hypothetical protein
MVLAKVCHIKGRKPGSPRYDATQSDEDRHGYDNLILMCGVHHDVIDMDEKSYTVERLHEIKTAHTDRAAKLPDEETQRGALILFTIPVTSFNQSGGITASSVTVNNFSLVGHDDLGKVFAKPSFPTAQSQEGDARFRKSTEPLGMLWSTRPAQEQVDVTLAKGRAVWLRLIPVDPSEGEFGSHELKRAATSGQLSLMPLVDMGTDYLVAENGFGVCNSPRSPDGVTSGVAFAFTTGEVWSIDVNLLNFDDKIYFDEIAKHLVTSVAKYGRFLGNLNVNPPYRWIAGLEGVSRMKLVFKGQGSFSEYFGGGPVCMSNTVADGGLYDGREDPWVTLAPFFDRLFKKSGANRPTHC